MQNIILVINVGTILVFLFETLLMFRQYLLLRKARNTEKTAMVYPEALDFMKMKFYNLAKLKVGFVSNLVSTIKTLLMVNFHLYSQLLFRIQQTTKEYLYAHIIFVMVLYVLEQIIGLPLSIYSTFYVEQQYGFNTTTPGLFVMDMIKANVLAALILPPILWVVLNLIDMYPTNFFLSVSLVLFIFKIVFIVLYPILIMPLFNKFTALEDGDLLKEIRMLAKRVGFRASKILQIDGSKRSHHSNAFFIGLFKEKRIVLFDTLIKDLSRANILAVLCHEFGHWWHKHTLKNIVLSTVILVSNLALFNWFSKYNLPFDPVNSDSIVLKMIYFAAVMTFISPIMVLMTNMMVRRYERQADVYAVNLGYGEDLKEALVELHKTNSASVVTDPWYSAYTNSHPTLWERIDLIDSELQKERKIE